MAKSLSMTQQCLGMEDLFPKNGSADEKLRFLIQYAILSPSVRNSQPWMFKVEKGTVSLFLDRSHAKRTSDPDVRELTISCGAALKHLCIAARKFGHEVVVERFPKGPGELLATVKLDGAKPAAEMDTVMFYAIHKWLAVPKPLRLNKRVPSDLLDELGWMGNKEPTWLYLARTEKGRKIMANAVAQADQIQTQSNAVAKKSTGAAAVKRRATDARSSLVEGAGHLADYVMHFFKREEGDATQFRKKKTELEKTEPVIAIIGTTTNSPEAWLATGERMAEILLRSMAAGVRASLINLPVGEASVRAKMLKELDISGFPQAYFRLGFPDAHAEVGSGTGINEQLL